jgi:hypothetical protein
MEDGRAQNNKHMVALSATQTEELNNSLAEYLKRNGYQQSFDVFVNETGAVRSLY